MKNAILYIRVTPADTYHFTIENPDGARICLTDRFRNWDTVKVQANFYVEQFDLAGIVYDLDKPTPL